MNYKRCVYLILQCFSLFKIIRYNNEIATEIKKCEVFKKMKLSKTIKKSTSKSKMNNNLTSNEVTSNEEKLRIWKPINQPIPEPSKNNYTYARDLIIPKDDQYNGMFKIPVTEITISSTQVTQANTDKLVWKPIMWVRIIMIRDFDMNISKNPKHMLLHLAKECNLSPRLKKRELAEKIEGRIEFE